MKNKRIKTIILSCLFVMLGVVFLPVVSKAKKVTLPVPAKVRVRSNKQERLKLTWKKVKGADGYQIYQYKAKNDQYEKIASVDKRATSWKSGRTLQKHTYKIRAYKKKGKRKIYSEFSYEVSAIPYRKNAKRVNAGRINVDSDSVFLSSWESIQIKAKMKNSKYAKNKKARVYDTKLRWYSSDEKVAKVDAEGNITAQGKTGKCKIYARAHNGNYDWLWVKVKNYARPDEFDGMENMQQDMVNMIHEHESDLKDIAEFFEKNKANHPDESQVINFGLDSGRNYVEAETIKGEVNYKEIETTMYRVMESFPGVMDIRVRNDSVHFILWGKSGGEFVELLFLFYDPSEEDIPGLVKESRDYFKTAPRWKYHYSRPGV